jgi:hypothetical protein
LRDYSGKFLLNNKGIEPITVYATLYNMSGQLVTIQPEIVGASSHRLIDLNNWALQGGESFKEGSIKIFHTGKDLVLGTQIYLENDNASLSFEEKLAELTKFDTRKQEAVWWMPNRQTDVKIALSNTSDTILSINATLSRKPKKVGVTENFTLQPHQTRLLDLRNDFADGSQFDNHDVIGLSLEHAGAKDALLARIMLKNDALGYSNVVQFSNPNTAKSNEYQGVGFHIDKLGGTQLEPIIIAKNVGTTDSNVQIKIPYTRNNATTNTIILPIEKLKPGEMSQINANSITNIALQENIKVAGIEVTYDTPNGSVIVAPHSISPNRNQVYRVPMWDPFQQKSPTGGYPWRIEPTSTTKAYIKNITDQEEDYVAFLLWQNGGEYMIGLKAIKPHQSIEIDVKKLRDDQTPDESGRIIPLNINNGQLQWTLHRKDTFGDDDQRGNFALIGRSEQIDFVKNTSSNYACQNCCGGEYAEGFVYPNNNVQIPQGNTKQFEAYESGATCYGSFYTYQIYPNEWISSNTNTATISQVGVATGVNAGTTNIKAKWRVYKTRTTNPCPPGPLLVECPGNIEQKFEKILAEKEEADNDDGNTPSIAACGSCTSFYVNISGNTDVTVIPPPQVSDVSAVGATKNTQITGNQNIIHFVTPKGEASSQVTLTATISPNNPQILSHIDWEGAVESPTNPLQATVSKSSASKNIIKIKFGNTILKEMRVWVVWATISSTDIPITSFNATTGNPAGKANAIKGGYYFTHTIQPSQVITDTDRPDFGGTNVNPPPGGNHPINGGQLSGGANKKWDNSRQIKFKILNPNSIGFNDTSFSTFGGFPLDVLIYPTGVEGNDDTTTTDPETNDPYSNSGVLTGYDLPITAICNRAGAEGNTFESRLQFREFTRLEIEGVWYRISDFFLWKFHRKSKRVSEVWIDDNSVKTSDNTDF